VIIVLLLTGLIISITEDSSRRSDEERILEEYEEAAARDRTVKITYELFRPPANPACPGAEFELQYIPDDYVEALGPGSGVVPFTANQLPHAVGQQSANGGVFANGSPTSSSYLKKFDSVPALIGFYANFSFVSIPPSEPTNTIFLQDFEFRGPSNLNKRRYMSAMTSDKLPLYASKIQTLANRLVQETSVDGNPFLSTLRRLLIELTLDIHLGEHPHPPEVVEYFTNFSDILGFISNPNIDLKDKWIRGRTIIGPVQDYFDERIDSIAESNDQSTFIYHWLRAGIDRRTVIRETIHNAVASNQIGHGIYRAIVTAKWSSGVPSDAGEFWYPQPIINPALSVDLFQKFIDATGDGVEELNVARELYRILAPNGNAFSRLSEEGDASNLVQVRTLWVPAMIASQGTGSRQGDQIQFFTYNTSLYADFETTIDTFTLPPPTVTLDDTFLFSPTDNSAPVNDGTVIQNTNPLVQPVFSNNLYAPFGLGYRRCPGEPLSMDITIKLLRAISPYRFEVEPVTGGTACNPASPDISRYISLAPRVAVFDNLFMYPKVPDT
jgi:hypothetical protein